MQYFFCKGQFAKNAFTKQKQQGEGRWTQSQAATVFLWFSHLLLSLLPHVHRLFFIPRQQTGLSKISPNFVALQGCFDLSHLSLKVLLSDNKVKVRLLEAMLATRDTSFSWHFCLFHLACANCLIYSDLENWRLWIMEARSSCYFLAVVCGETGTFDVNLA